MKPEYQFFKNFKYAREGFLEVCKKEKSFKLQIGVFLLFTIIALLLNIPIWAKMFMIGSLVIPIIVELLNSSIERVVDLVTEDYHKLAKYAKDAAAAAVMVSFLFPFFIWGGVILYFMK
jgi:diacylglycerol kinase (ATP)